MREILAHLSFVDWCVAVGTLCALITVLYAALERHWPKDHTMTNESRMRHAAPWVLVVLAWAAIGIDVVDRHFFSGPPIPIVQDYGMISAVGGFYVSANTNPLLKYKDTHRLMLIMRVNYSDVDRMTDTRIEKSGLYTITGLVTQLAVILPIGFKMNISKTQNNMLDYVLVKVPANVSRDSITSLSELERLGGEIVDEKGQGFGPLEIRQNTSPSSGQAPPNN